MLLPRDVLPTCPGHLSSCPLTAGKGHEKDEMGIENGWMMSNTYIIYNACATTIPEQKQTNKRKDETAQVHIIPPCTSLKVQFGL